ncbi:MAG: ATP synthase F1 subunit gamma [bacterium]|nr:ATP synthase F1 subunit gamma [bacterium]
MASSRQLKSKIRTVGNIKQITRAMQMVAATKMRKSQEVALMARPFAKKALSLLSAILTIVNGDRVDSMFFKERKEGKVCLIVVTSDKGLAGSFNGQVLRMAAQWVEKQKEDIDIVAVGKKGRDFFQRRGTTPVAEFFQFSDIVTLYDVAPVSEWVLQAYEKGTYRKIIIASTLFFSALVQKPAIRQILPLNLKELKEAVENIVSKTGKYSEWKGEEIIENETSSLQILEPNVKAIMETLVRGLLEVEILHFIFESNASEHSSRMVAMKSATENASSVEEELRLKLNKERQAAITQELTEISTASEALAAE